MTVEEIIQKIKQEAKNKSKDENTNEEYVYQESFATQEMQESRLYSYAKKIGKYLQKKGLGGLVNFLRRNLNLQQYSHIYEMQDFTKYRDEEFIDKAYQLILNREADIQGKNNYLSKLRAGTLSKAEIIVSLHFSKEGKTQNITINGAKKQYLLTQLYKVPFIGYITKLVVTAATLPKVLNRINQNENHIESESISQTNNYLKLTQTLATKATKQAHQELEQLLHKQLHQQQMDLDTKATKDELKEIIYVKEYMQVTKESIQTLVEEAKKRLPQETLTSNELVTIIEEEEHALDTFYVSFEDKFRGSKQEIKEKLKVYLPYIEKVSQITQLKEEFKLLDVGCGRGEWLELLSEQGYKSTKGIDLNRVMVSISKALDQDVECIDVIKYLKSLKDETLAVITGFHIIEHLPFKVLMELFQESRRVLKKGGMIIYETPNPRNILVGSSDFYLDPTHINPIHPATLSFLVEQSGFTQVESLILENGTLTNFETLKFDDIYDYINIGRDLVVVGYKS